MARVTLDKILENRPLQVSELEVVLTNLRDAMALLDGEVMLADALNTRTGDDRRLEWATVVLRRLSDAEQALLALVAVYHGPGYGLREPDGFPKDTECYEEPETAPEPVWTQRAEHARRKS